MPHTTEKRYAVVSCHVEQPLDDRVFELFSRLQRSRPGGFRIAAMLRPPDPDAGEPEARWLERAREAARRGPLGHHTHFVGPQHARPAREDPAHAARVLAEAQWLRERGLRLRLFCGGGWYMDAGVASVLAEHGYADCTATSFRPSYLAAGAPRLSLDEPAWLALPQGRLLELPTTHSLGMAARAVLRPRSLGQPVVHVYFHDTDLVDRRRGLALVAALTLLARRRRPADLEQIADELAATAPELPFGAACG